VKLIVGLGNPGRQYEAHRHNVGFWVLDLLATRMGISLEKKFMGALTDKGRISGEDAILAKPQTFMNLSGDSVGPILRFYKLAPEDLIVVHDDIDIALGKLKLAKGSGHGGHNGVRSIIDTLGSNDFFRVRVGVGRPPQFMDSADHVLTPFLKEEMPEVERSVENAAEAVAALIEKGLERAQGTFH